MDSASRACVAYVAGRVVVGKNSSHIYDYDRSRHVSIGGTIDGKQVSVYDYDRGCHFSGTLPSLYDYGRSCHVSVEIKGRNFSGYDYGSSAHFSGSVSGSSVSLYDYGTSQHYSYGL